MTPPWPYVRGGTGWVVPPQGQGAWIRSSAIEVMVLTPVITLVGFFMARRVAPVVRVEVPLADLPPQLEGFTIAQISDIHVGPTIKRNFVEAIVDRVNRLSADMVAITGDVVDGSVPASRGCSVVNFAAYAARFARTCVSSPHAAVLAAATAADIAEPWYVR